MMGIAQIALDPSPFVKRANVGKKVPQTILASLYTPLPLRAMPIWKQHISKRGYSWLFYFFNLLVTYKKHSQGLPAAFSICDQVREPCQGVASFA